MVWVEMKMKVPFPCKHAMLNHSQNQDFKIYVHFKNRNGFLAVIDFMNVKNTFPNNQERKTFLLDKKTTKLLITLPSLINYYN